MDPHDLYGLPLERFVPERTALAKELRRAGERERATKVSALRKPSVSAWAVNQLVRTQARDVSGLFSDGDAAREAQAGLLSGRGDPAALREALAREREAVSRLVEVARGLLTSDGHELSPPMLARVADTLHAAALDDEARALVREGRLERELRHVGLSSGALTGSSAPTARGPARARKDPAARPRTDMAALRKRVDDARRAADRAARDLAAAQAKREAAAEAAKAADDAVASARADARRAQAAHREATRDLEKARRKR